MIAPELAAAVLATYHVWSRTVDAVGPALAGHDLTEATFQALWLIDPDEPSPSMKVMAERLHCNAPNLTFVASQLIDRGLVDRAVDPADRRSRVLVLTPKGRQVRAELVEAVTCGSPLAKLPAEDQLQLAALLGRALE
ncbi:MarR family transcriptional regulator [Actinoplanes sp. NBRC 103695]|uniref:MarR family winged helix-turn-helix transcriptional regulator n=1 Tax=Actinoplanes sp. NBRC 103695 TaxID=3032202 RepID=UPI00249FE63C|nr:MarR family transcriptional regulator [Actinoplanes sp. NBRC 103695]GLY97254.1 DNA-binding protein [Actinoplanes sp. NBRC 103695]